MAKPEPYIFFWSYARADDKDGPELERFFQNLCKEVRGRMGLETSDRCGFRDDRGIELGAPDWTSVIGSALAEARAFVALYSPTYFKREACGKEWAIFRERLLAVARERGESLPPPLIFPVLWLPLKARFARLPQHVRDIQYAHAELGAVYAEKGLRTLMRSHDAEYRRFLDAFGEKMALAVEEHALPPAAGIERLDAIESAFADIVWDPPATVMAPIRPVERPRERSKEREDEVEGRRDDFLSRVERAVRLREEPVGLERMAGTGSFGDHLRVTVLQGGQQRPYPVGAVEWQVSLENLSAFHQEIVAPYRWGDPGAGALLIYGGEPASEDLRKTADAWKIRLVRFREYQRLIDFTGYLERQTQRLAAESAYPSSLYVPQRLLPELGKAGAVLDDALGAVEGWLSDPQGRFVLILGDFGTGKTFLLYEMARRLVRAEDGPVPILLQMRSLEKGKSLSGLLALHFADAQLGDFSVNKFRYLLEEGLVALLFDGFDELALRVTYPRAVEHFDTLLEAAAGRAKVVATSRKQHFLTDDQVKLALFDRVDAVPGRRIVELLPFTDEQIFQFLLHHSGGDEPRARRRLELIDRVKNLMGLSHNPRLLGFIAELPEEKLTAAAGGGGMIRAADLYQILVDQWLEGETRRMDDAKRSVPGLSAAVRLEIVTALALRLWEKTERFLSLAEIQQEAARIVGSLKDLALDPEAAAFQAGSGTLFQRDEDGRFSFLHQSILEWLVARKAAAEVAAGGEAPALGWREMSWLMTEFFCDLAGREGVVAWARAAERTRSSEVAGKNARLVLQWLKEELVERRDLAGKDLRGESFRGQNLDGADLSGANLEGVVLAGASLRGAVLYEARLRGADLSGAILTGADLRGADFREAHLVRADLRQSDLTRTRLHRAKLIGARSEPGALPHPWGAALAILDRLEGWRALRLDGVNSVAWSPDGTLVASGSSDNRVRLWEASSGREVRRFEGHGDRVWGIAFSPGGEQLASGSSDKTVRLWEASSGREVRRFEGHGDSVLSVAFSPDGEQLASGSDDKTLRLWEVSSGREVCRFEGHGDRVLSVVFDPGGEQLASGSADHTMRLWEAASGREVRRFEGHSDRVLSVAFSPGSEQMASSSSDKTLRLWEVSSGREVLRFEGHGKWVRSVAFSPDGKQLASGSDDNTVRLWEATSGREVRRFEGHGKWVRSVTFSPDGKQLASGSDDHTVRLWEATSGREVRRFEGHGKWVRSVAFSPGGEQLASGSSDHTVRLWEAASGREVCRFEGHGKWVRSVAFSPGGEQLASGSDDHTVRLWEAASGRELRRFEGHGKWVRSVAFSPGGEQLASGSDDHTVRLWEVARGLQIQRFEGHGATIWSVAFSPDGEQLASGSSDNTVRLWEAASGRELHRFEGHGKWVRSVAFSPGGEQVASGSFDKTVRLWEAASGQEVRRFEGHGDRVWSVAFSPDNEQLASGSSDNTVRLWEAASGRELRRFEGHGDSVRSVAFSPGGDQLASASDDGTIRLWEVATGRCFAILCSLPDGWAAFTPDGRYKVGGIPAGGFWHVIELCRFEPGELDDLIPGLRLPDDASFLDLPPWTARLVEPR